MKYKINGKEIDIYSKNLDELINNKFENIVNEIKDLANNSEWNGPAKEAFKMKYENIVNEINKIPYFTSFYIDFLYNTVSSYSETIDELNVKFQEFNNKIEVKEKRNG